MRHALIMAGGSGTRLWPLSTREVPKQLSALIDGRSLLELACERVSSLLDADCVWVCAGEQHREAILALLPGLGTDRFLGEPEGRDTLNAIGLGAAVIAREDRDAVMSVLTADQLIEPADGFQNCLEQAYAVAQEGEDRLVTFSIVPTYAATGYGYIERGVAIAGHDAAYEVVRYVEKPDQQTAEEYLRTGRFSWNSGMFVWRAQTFLDAMREFAPENYAGIEKIGKDWGTANQWQTLGKVFPSLPRISVDYAVLEPASTGGRFAVSTVVADISWRDVGSWQSLAETVDADRRGNRVAPGSRAALEQCDGTFVFSSDPSHLIAVLGVEDLVVVHTPRATLVMPAREAEWLKELHGKIPDELR